MRVEEKEREWKRRTSAVDLRFCKMERRGLTLASERMSARTRFIPITYRLSPLERAILSRSISPFSPRQGISSQRYPGNAPSSTVPPPSTRTIVVRRFSESAQGLRCIQCCMAPFVRFERVALKKKKKKERKEKKVTLYPANKGTDIDRRESR